MVPTAHTDEKALYRAHSDMLKAISGALRHELIHHLVPGPRTVTELAELSGASASSVSQHMSALGARGLVERQRKGQHVEYELVYPQLAQACALIDEILIDQAQKALGIQSDRD
jgi:ArsR family transcriptional regulator